MGKGDLLCRAALANDEIITDPEQICLLEGTFACVYYGTDAHVLLPAGVMRIVSKIDGVMQTGCN